MSEKSVAQKLQIHEGHKLLIVNPPKGYRESLVKGLAKNVVFLKEAKFPADIIQVFVTSKRELGEQLVKLKPLLGSGGIFWVTYPKRASRIRAGIKDQGGHQGSGRASRIRADINRDIIRQQAQSLGLEAVAIFSVDNDWSALRLKLV